MEIMIRNVEKSIAALFTNTRIMEKCSAKEVALMNEWGVRGVPDNPFKIIITKRIKPTIGW